jgi:hypothetical protein
MGRSFLFVNFYLEVKVMEKAITIQEAMREYWREYYRKNKDKVRENQKRYYERKKNEKGGNVV